MRVLLIEDDPSTAQSVELILRSQGFTCQSTDLGEEGLEIGRLYDYDIIILDLMLPDIDGREVLRRLRTARINTPVLVLSALCSLENITKCLHLGANDYLTKPFDKRELLARVETVVYRSQSHAPSVIKTGKLRLCLSTRSVQVDGKPVRLTSKEYEILEFLSLHKGTVLAKETFLDHLYGSENEPEPQIIDVYMCKLRKKLASASGGEIYIKTVWGRGYELLDPDRAPQGLVLSDERGTGA